MKVVEIFADSQYTAFAMNMALESFVDGGAFKRVLEDLPGSVSHLASLDGWGQLGHGEDYRSDE